MDYISLETILSRGEIISPRVLYLLLHPLVECLMELRDNANVDEKWQLSTDSIVFSTDFKAIKVLKAGNEVDNIINWGHIILTVVNRVGYNDRRLKAIATDCVEGNIGTLEELHLILERRVSRSIYYFLIFIVLMGLAIMAIMNFF